ncbi:MAG: SAM-dependent methyltransferase [Thermodesulfobacteriaceae bacterium]|nr:SAM-dependent methyltransferase [Thermodesulfobacteriaceae bacterium]MCX8042329.1 SAM-dependent methyltransferase [Thermodesulfobacteriaceae bacterium]MDW8135782.1 SAM-dependent methyltransferase [Thermodesulfobacterium sp.]
MRKIFLSIIFFVLAIGLSLAQTPEGKLYLVSTGVGDKDELDNLTLKALKVIEKAEIIFCSPWTCERMKELIQGKKVYDAGFGIYWVYYKKPDPRFNLEEKQREFERINQIIREAIKQGKTVVVLEDGDPTIFGPHIWYMDAFKDLNPKIIPGVSSFNAANAAIKSRVTGGKAGGVALVSGFSDLENLAKTGINLVLFTMRIKDITEVLKKIEKYYSPKTQVIFVLYAGFREKERVIAGTFEDIYEKIKDVKLPFEYLVYIGDFSYGN